jgi:hypothetical protein
MPQAQRGGRLLFAVRILHNPYSSVGIEFPSGLFG